MGVKRVEEGDRIFPIIIFITLGRFVSEGVLKLR